MPNEKPSLAEIAGMPFPASVEAMRRHYIHDWGKPVPEGVSRKRAFEVEVEYTVTEVNTDRVTVEAFSADEAEELAADKVRVRHRHADDIDVMNTKAKLKEEGK